MGNIGDEFHIIYISVSSANNDANKMVFYANTNNW